MIFASLSLSISSGGTAMPVPASTARAWVIYSPSMAFRDVRVCDGPAPDPVGLAGRPDHGQVAPLDEAIETRGLLAVEPRRGRLVVVPGHQRALARRGRDFIVG